MLGSEKRLVFSEVQRSHFTNRISRDDHSAWTNSLKDGIEGQDVRLGVLSDIGRLKSISAITVTSCSHQ